MALAFSAATSLALAAQAPTGAYQAVMGATGATGGGAVIGAGGGGASGVGGTVTAGTLVNMNITKYITEEDLATLQAAQGDPKAFADALAKLNCGSVTIGKQTFQVNAAQSVQAGSEYLIFLLGGKGFLYEAANTPHTLKAGTVGYIRLAVNSSGKGGGMMYSATAVTLEKNGQIKAGAAAATATKLNDVHR
ncbi:MAG: hypothetical protein HYV63_00720 [Candidatus Schekmanbacteria bacterium]|nr:hypothetical protein [Candidatus Schekmanbacteria bacterium]